MTFSKWGLRALSLLAAPFALTTASFAQDTPAPAVFVEPSAQAGSAKAGLAEIPAPRALQSVDETPWLYRGSDVPVDREWLFGEMENGLRYAVRKNGVPPQQVSIRVRIDAGSLHERDFEQGYAHLLEHLLFRESKYLGQAEAIEAWQRLGATFGSDANAETSPTHTAYKLDLPNATRDKLIESFKYLAGMIREPVLNDANVATELPIVLAEKRERGGAAERVSQLTRTTYFAGQRLATRSPIGTVETLNAATGAKVAEFHRRWYRPENAVIVVAGDADPQVLAGLVEQWFGDWQGVGEPVEAPNFGDPIAPQGATIAAGTGWPIGELGVAVEPDLPRNLTYVIMRPWRQVDDTIVYNEGRLLDLVAQRVINRRLESRARGGASFLYASVGQSDISRSTDATLVNFAPLTSDWAAALADVRAVIADAINSPPTQEEIDREAAEFAVIYDNLVEQESVQSGSSLADSVVSAVDIREAVASPEVIRDVFQGMKPRLNPEEILARTQALFRGDVVRSVYVTPQAGEADDAALRVALAREIKSDSSARLAARTIAFEDLPEIGKPGQIVSRAPLGVFEIEQVEFANGARALLWANDAEPGRVTVRVRFGSGYRAFDDQTAVYAKLGEGALFGSGIGDLGNEEIDRLLTGRKLGLGFAIDEGVFTFTAQTRASDVEDQLYLFAAKLGMPRWDADPVIRAKAAMKLTYGSYATSPNGILNRDLEYLSRDRDLRFAQPGPQALDGATPEGFKQVWEPLLQQGPIEILVFGDYDKEAVVTKLAQTFGALPERAPIPAQARERSVRFPAYAAMPTVLEHRGDANQAAAVVSWETGGGVTGIREARRIEILVQLFNNRLLEAMREKLGASYSPQVFSQWPKDIPAGGNITAIALLEPENVPVFFSEASRIANDLAANPPAADEIERVTGPLAQLIRRASTGNQFWLYNLEGASFDRRHVQQLPFILRDFSITTPLVMQQLAERYFTQKAPMRLAIIAQGSKLAEVEPQARPDPSAARLQAAPVRGPGLEGR